MVSQIIGKQPKKVEELNFNFPCNPFVEVCARFFKVTIDHQNALVGSPGHDNLRFVSTCLRPSLFTCSEYILRRQTGVPHVVGALARRVQPSRRQSDGARGRGCSCW